VGSALFFDMEALEAQSRYKILTATVTPRPIAWVTTRSEKGVVNAAPFSFFNVMGHEPPTIALGLLAGEGRFKDTAANILETGEFVVNLVSEANAEAMNVTCIDAPSDVDELTLAGLTAVASRAIGAPRIAESPVSFECRVLASLVTGPRQTMVVGRVIGAHIDGALVQDRERCYIDTKALRLIARMHGSGWYARSTDLFQMDRPKWADWQRDGSTDQPQPGPPS
jgi:flavin reductase (DIM6/NTAB) family NADH-FMN oxidoreductase RutF